MTTKIGIQGHTKSLSKIKLKACKSTIVQVLANHEKTAQQLSFNLVSDKKILEINKQYLQHDYYTDIITFDLSESPSEVIADIYISFDTVASNAAIYNVTESIELLRVIFHGALHLCGYRDKTASQQKRMRAKEEECLNLYRQKTGILELT